MSPTAAARSPASATTVATAVYRVQLALFDGAATSNEPLLHAAAALLSCADYADVVSERSIASCCGHPACANALHPDPNPNPPHFRISLREHRVYDLEESRKFCSEGCLVASAAFAASLPPDRPFGVPPSRLDAVVALFEGGRNGEGLGFGADGGKEERRKVEIREKENPGEGEVTLEEWIGPPGAIDGYVPRQDRSGEGPKQKAKQNKAGRAEHSRAENATSNNTATDEDDIGIFPPSVDMQEISEVIAKKLEDVALNENTKAKKKEETKSSPKTFNQDEDGNMLSSCISDSIAKQLEDVVLKEKKKATKSSSRASKTKPITKTTGSDGHEVDFTSTIIIGDHALGRTDQGIVGQHNFASFELAERQASSSKYTAVDSKQFHSEQLHDEFRKVVSLGKDETSDEKIKPALKSSKTDGSKNRSHSVRWADQNETGGDTGRNKASESHSNDRKLPEEDKDSSLRHASAEACAAALIEAAEAISSGTAEEEDAVSKAGIIILPNMSAPPQYNHDEVVEEQNIFEIDKGVVKWPKKTVLLDRDMFEVEDSWHDMPPDGFSLTLSAFATMWATLFGWISCLSLVYIYGIDESCVEEILITNGREYPQKIVLKEGHSSEIRRALDTCVCNALPGLVSNLRLQIPVSKLEITLGYLLDTMSFVDALPSLKARQWQVVVLVMLDALSVHRLPALAPLMTDTMLLQKVLDAAQISREEYNSMIDLFLPFGRSTQTTLHRS